MIFLTLCIFINTVVPLFIPTGHSNGSKCVIVPIAIDFAKALEIIYNTIGCTNVVKKPQLKYWMVKTGQNEIMLESSEDWDEMIQHTKRLLQSQKDKSMVIGKIDIDLEVYSSYTYLTLIFINYIFLSSIFRPSILDSVGDDEELEEDEVQGQKHLDEFIKLNKLLTSC